jgi:hypothetical protein
VRARFEPRPSSGVGSSVAAARRGAAATEQVREARRRGGELAGAACERRRLGGGELRRGLQGCEGEADGVGAGEVGAREAVIVGGDASAGELGPERRVGSDGAMDRARVRTGGGGLRTVAGELGPAASVSGDAGVAARGAAGERVVGRAGAVELDADAGEPAGVGAQAAAAGGEAGGEVVEPAAGEVVVAPAGGIGGVGADPLPEGERQVRGQAVAGALDDGVELDAPGIAVALRWMDPVRHRVGAPG